MKKWELKLLKMTKCSMKNQTKARVLQVKDQVQVRTKKMIFLEIKHPLPQPSRKKNLSRLKYKAIRK